MNDFDRRNPKARVAEARGELQRGRDAFARRAWADAYSRLSRADRSAPLEGEDLALLAASAYLIGRDDDYLRTLERAYHACLDAGKSQRAIRCAFWLGLRFVLRGEKGPAAGWLARAQRLLENEESECVERGYLLLPVVLQHLNEAELQGAFAVASDAAEIGERFGDKELTAAARHMQGRALIRQGQVEKGLAFLDEVMIAATAGELSSFLTGFVYCSVIDGCQEVYELGRAREWTAALADWCAEQPELVFTGKCLVHRSQIMQMNGAWTDAIEEARRAGQHLSQRPDLRTNAAALYQQAELHRLRGEFEAAEEAYRGASQSGWEPQPGLALLRMMQGRIDVASAAIRRAVGTTTDRLQRTRLLPACVEIMLATGDFDAARGAAYELEAIAESFDTTVLHAMAAHARGAVALGEGNAQAAMGTLRRAFEAWQDVEAPYLAARVRMQIGLACRALGDEDGARLDLAAARAVFDRLGAAPDLAGIEYLMENGASDRTHGLTRRELQVLRIVAAGKTNRAIATELFLSEKTIDRHVSNIFNKLDVPSRTAAAAFAYEHGLISALKPSNG